MAALPRDIGLPVTVCAPLPSADNIQSYPRAAQTSGLAKVSFPQRKTQILGKPVSLQLASLQVCFTLTALYGIHETWEV